MPLFSKTYHQAASDQWVVFIHGAGGSSNIWRRQLTAFQQHFNLLTIDLRGHGKSTLFKTTSPYHFNLIINDIITVLNTLDIEKAHFVGISLGSLLSNLLAIKFLDRVSSLVLGGSISRINIKARILLSVGNVFKKVIPFLWLYKIFATIVLPKKNHQESRRLFIKEAKRMDQEQFLKWFALTSELPEVLRQLRTTLIVPPTIFIQGKEDHMFLQDLLKAPNSQKQTMKVIPNCGHVVNIEKPTLFNKMSINFIQKVVRQLTVT